MKYEIDQSGKIEQTSLNTVIALSNDKQYAIFLGKKEKRVIQKVFKELGKPTMFIYLTFALLIAITLKDTQPEYKVIIDREYKGHEDMLKAWIIQMLKRIGAERTPYIEFNSVGKSSPAHALAAKVAHKKRKPERKLSAEEVLELILEKEK